MNFWDRMTPVTRILLILIVGGGIITWVALRGGSSFLKKVVPTPKQTYASNLSSDEEQNVIRVAINTWSGYAGLAYANSGFEPNKESIFYKKYGQLVKLVYIDPFDESRQAWKSNKVDVLWGTLDAFPTEVNGLAENKPRAFVNVDWSRGGDVIVGVRGINSMNDLRGKKVAFAPTTPSHSMLLMALKASNMSMSDIQAVEVKDAIAASEVFKAGEADACVTWSPNDQQCLHSVKGSKIVISTQTLTNAIADVFYAKEDYINTHQQNLQNFVNGLLEGNALVSTDEDAKSKAKDYLSKGMGIPVSFFDSTISKAHLCTYGDNLNFFGLNSTYVGINGDELYNKMSREFAKINAAPASVPSSKEILYAGFIQNAPNDLVASNIQKAEGMATFTPPTKTDKTAPEFSDKPVTITFDKNSAELSLDAKNIIDHQFADEAKTFAKARIRIIGNTDNTGSDEINIPLSKRRAQSVANYLSTEYGFDKNRFIVLGNGSKKPVASNNNEEGRTANRRTDFQLLPNEELTTLGN